MAMGALVDYFKKLKSGTPIYSEILDTIRNTRFLQEVDGWQQCYWNVNYQFDFRYIRWSDGFISFGYSERDKDILSLPFSGCCMVVYEGVHGWTGAHIHLGGENDKRNLWNEYVDSRFSPTQCILHRPDCSIRKMRSYNANEIWGIISNNVECYNVLINRTIPTTFRHFERAERQNAIILNN